MITNHWLLITDYESMITNHWLLITDYESNILELGSSIYIETQPL